MDESIWRDTMISLIVAHDNNYVIGYENGMPCIARGFKIF